MKTPYPFSAIVGQEMLKTALSIVAVDPHIGGVLAFGDRGTGKSTAVRALANLLPNMPVREGCAYNCVPGRESCPEQSVCAARAEGEAPIPVVDLPLGSTEDRIVGALDLERALSRGEKVFEPGLLARANRGFLYIDEVNLLEDHLVDLLLDVASSGENVVEREGLSIRHGAQVVLVGSGNPEEGELRPQLLDRFGLSVEVRTPTDLKSRIEVVLRRDAFERDREAFARKWQPADRKIQARIELARERLDAVSVPRPVLEKASSLAIALGTDGLRGELTLMRAARALTAFEGRKKVRIQDLRAVAGMALSHRLRRDPLDESGSAVRVLRAVDEVCA
ncbi:MAG: magnesium chelatase ATPase subunit I [Pseudomonadota bacterium]